LDGGKEKRPLNFGEEICSIVIPYKTEEMKDDIEWVVGNMLCGCEMN
jgi:hypothetical protein